MMFQASGWVEPDPYITNVPTLLNGVVNQVHVLEGQRVKKGDLLATLIDDDAKLNLQLAERQVESQQKRIKAHYQNIHIIQAELQAAQKKISTLQAKALEAKDLWQRYSKVSKGSIPEREVAASRFNLQSAEAQVAEAQASLPKYEAQLTQVEFERITMTSALSELQVKLAQAKLALDRTRITSPIDGIVLHLHIAPGAKRMFCLLYTSPSPRDQRGSRMPSSA